MYEIYTVAPMDTLDSIAQKYGVTKELLSQINGISKNYVLSSGMQIVVPVQKNQPYQYYTVKKGDNMYEIAKKNNLDYSLLLQLNGLEENDYIYPNQTILLPKKGFKIYLTRSDDTLQEILRKMGISIEELMNENEKIYLRPEQLLVFLEK